MNEVFLQVMGDSRIRLRLLTALLVAGLAIHSGPAAAAERTIPYADLHSMFARLEKLQGGKYFHADARLSSADPLVPTAKLRLVIQSRSGEIPVPIAPDGTTSFPVRADLLAENPPVLTNAAKGKLQLSVSLRVEAPPVDRFRYGLLVAMKDEADEMIARQGIMARMLAPDFGGLEIRFPAGEQASATLESAKGAKTFAADAEGIIRIPDRRDWRREDPWIQLSSLPEQIALGVD